ncbi:hypothetical protein EBZ39_01975 [bacterium]|nr:hypothetical protein [bacterium]
MSYYEAKQKHEQAQMPDKFDLLCSAFECPMEWSVDKGMKLCSHHAWSESHDWPKITEWLKSKVVMGTLETFKGKIEQSGYLPLDPYKKTPQKTIKDVLEAFKAPKDPKAWAHKLKNREETGQKLSVIQKKAWREALRVV